MPIEEPGDLWTREKNLFLLRASELSQKKFNKNRLLQVATNSLKFEQGLFSQ
jgi:hypothetical protein